MLLVKKGNILVIILTLFITSPGIILSYQFFCYYFVALVTITGRKKMGRERRGGRCAAPFPLSQFGPTRFHLARVVSTSISPPDMTGTVPSGERPTGVEPRHLTRTIRKGTNDRNSFLAYVMYLLYNIVLDPTTIYQIPLLLHSIVYCSISHCLTFFCITPYHVLLSYCILSFSGLLYCIIRVDEILEVPLSPLNNVPSQGQQLSTPTVKSVGEALLHSLGICLNRFEANW
ncbi:hypothetical protein CHARACLAT_026780 [Characodon lateralis]|uniref:Uncharacterized protein n=1 Tax=Characodon lateralis TaxID=208331 RepID=A0ABU7E598_9TELE|nr:hypothetical protein [Characodon lateralis]